MTPRVERLEPGEGDAAWDAYVGPRTRSALDLAAWRRVVSAAYGLRARFMLALHGGRPCGALGLYEVRHAVFGHCLVTAPFGNDGGLFAESEPARSALLREARLLADELRVGDLVIRTRDPDLPGFTPDRSYVTATLDLRAGPAAAWTALPPKTRNQVRRGRKEGFRVRAGREHWEAFHRVFREHLRDLGSPTHSRRFHELVACELAERVRFLVVVDGEEAVAGALVLHHGGRAANLQAVALKRYSRRCPNYLLYWHVIEESARAGCDELDMGRSVRGGSVLAFKENWRPRVEDLTYHHYLPGGGVPPFRDPRNPRYRLGIAAWRRLPLAITNRLGPWLMAGLP